jgi:hypothetical protein
LSATPPPHEETHQPLGSSKIAERLRGAVWESRVERRVSPKVIAGASRQLALRHLVYWLSVRQLHGKGCLSPETDRLDAGTPFLVVADTTPLQPRMRRFVHDGCSNDLRRRGQDVPRVQLAGAQSVIVAAKSARQHDNPHAFQIAAQPAVSHAIMSLDEI